MQHIGKILPVDGYYVSLCGSLPIDYAKSLTHLYQPLIGIHAMALYQTLLHEIDLQGESLQTHHTLMNYLNLPLDDLYQARLKLEGIGLLKTYEKTEPTKSYLYELISPFSPNRFFQDAMLSQLLYHHIGELKYNHLKSHFTTDIDQQKEDYQQITTSFNEVFQTVHPSMEHVQTINKMPDERGPVLETIDFGWLEQMLKKQMIPAKKVLTKSNKRIIKQMKVLYELTFYEIEKALLWALTEEHVLSIEEFKEACHDLFKAKYQQPIQLMTKNESKVEQTKVEQPRTKEEQLIHELETISPQQLLADLSSGNQASEQDMKAIREVMTSQGLPVPVMNVLIHYVLLQSNMKLSKPYLEKIASHWSRAKLKTAKEAMEFAKNEKNRYRKVAANRTNRNFKRNHRQRSVDIVPEWFKERKKEQKTSVLQNKQAVNIEKEKEEMKAFINKYASDKNKHFQG
ncbi:MAG TPA: DnaD domain protein [Bacillota bacterium]